VAQQTVLTAIGADRPGLVEEVSEFVFARGGNVEDSRMANMHGQFAIVMLVGGPQEALERMAADLDALAERTAIDARLTPVSEGAAAATARTPYRLTGQALDQAGLVHEVANVLRGLDVNIETMDTTLEPAPVTGTPVFAMDLVVGVPDATPVDALHDELARVCDALNIDWKLERL
jgi:glycine cleavage system transcriptional repressor